MFEMSAPEFGEIEINALQFLYKLSNIYSSKMSNAKTKLT